MFTVSYDLKQFFFDRERTQALVEKEAYGALYRMAHFIRQEGRRIQKKKGYARKPPKNANGKAYQRWLNETKNRPSSPPGQPPHSHTDHKVTTLRNILYGYDPMSGGLIVGPVGLNQKRWYNGLLQSGAVPSLHEFGGSMRFKEKQVGTKWVPVGRRKPRPGQPARTRQANYPARPYMKPSLIRAISKFPDAWYGTSKGDGVLQALYSGNGIAAA